MNVIKTAKERMATVTKVIPNIEGPTSQKGLTETTDKSHQSSSYLQY